MSERVLTEEEAAAVAALVNAAPRKPPTPAEINKRNRAFYNEGAPLPSDPLDSIRLEAARQVHLKAISEAESMAQSARAKKPRPKKNSTHRLEFIKAMRVSRAQGQTLEGFIQAAEAGSLDGNITIERDGQMLTVDCDAVASEKKVSPRTLSDWWAQAGKPSTTD